MSEIEELKREISELREELESLKTVVPKWIKDDRRRLVIIENFLSFLTDRPLNALFKNFGLWAQDEDERLDQADQELLEKLERGWNHEKSDSAKRKLLPSPPGNFERLRRLLL
ncbi:hypothetical protein [Sinisalibacter lacisalsi]|uniref:Uncharacterized protein n=1 Tax=Sinisalibacter lacisalsi TaxID=1526570 RepID=A0ABQ1QRA7_9RHOB|nr:hypothetical protein [Sinisalibacter lacisalsi]GGD42128.1 hypothetical protein GCM10011358_27510 [Sinisalibacter lacisalsi]